MIQSLNWEEELLQYSADYAEDVDRLQRLCGGLAEESGWNNKPLDVPCYLMLIVSELGEAMEGHRKSLQDDHLPEHPSLHVELADVMIRVLHLADRLHFDLGNVMMQKLRYNQTREDHKPEVRAAAGGKAY